jgi:hypothetical protein
MAWLGKLNYEATVAESLSVVRIRSVKKPEESARELLASGDKWADRMARTTLPILLWAAQHHQPITYKQLAEELADRTGEPIKRRMTLYGKPAGKIGDVLILLARDTGWDIPPLNAIVINAGTKLPGDGATDFIKRLLLPSVRRSIAKGDTTALAKAAVESALNHTDWARVANALKVGRLLPVRVLKESKPENEPIKRPKPASPDIGYAETAQHKALKRWAAANPWFFRKYGQFGHGRNEARLESGDKLDALLISKTMRLAIEVKASNAPDLEVYRGIFQCVKYRATLKAMQTADGVIPNANAVLLLTRSGPADAQRLARRLQVDVLIAPAGADRG